MGVTSLCRRQGAAPLYIIWKDHVRRYVMSEQVVHKTIATISLQYDGQNNAIYKVGLVIVIG